MHVRVEQQLGEELGRGSSGKVYRALNLETGDFRAIKEIPTQNMPVGHLEAVRLRRPHSSPLPPNAVLSSRARPALAAPR